MISNVNNVSKKPVTYYLIERSHKHPKKKE